MPLHWTQRCPPGSQIWTEIDGDELVVSCNAPGDPRAPDIPSAAGTCAGQLDANTFYSLQWEFSEGQLTVVDLDVTLSLDDEAG